MEMPLKHNGLNRSLWNDTFKEQTSFDPDSSAGSSLRKVCMSETVTAQSRMVVSVSLRVYGVGLQQRTYLREKTRDFLHYEVVGCSLTKIHARS